MAMSTLPMVTSAAATPKVSPEVSNDDCISDAFSYLSWWVIFLMKRSTGGGWHQLQDTSGSLPQRMELS
jgi:hypothetical protein